MREFLASTSGPQASQRRPCDQPTCRADRETSTVKPLLRSSRRNLFPASPKRRGSYHPKCFVHQHEPSLVLARAGPKPERDHLPESQNPVEPNDGVRVSDYMHRPPLICENASATL